MKMPPILLTLLLQLPACQPFHLQSRREPKADGGLRMSLRAERETIRTGEDVILTLAFENVTDQVIKACPMDPQGENWYGHIVVPSPGYRPPSSTCGLIVRPRPAWPCATTIGRRHGELIPIPAKRSHKTTFELSKARGCGLLPAGKYQVWVEYWADREEPPLMRWHLVSNAATIRVLREDSRSSPKP